MIKKLALMLWLLAFSASVCFGNEIRASDVAYAFIVLILQATIAYVIWGIIWKIFKRKKDGND